MPVFAFHIKNNEVVGEVDYFFAEGSSIRPVIDSLSVEQKQRIKGAQLICITAHADHPAAVIAAKKLYLELLP